MQYCSAKKGLLFKEPLKSFLRDEKAFIREVALDELDDLNNNGDLTDQEFISILCDCIKYK